jgi:hypothetical protein
MGIETALLVAAVAGAGASAYGQIQQGKERDRAAVAQGQELSMQAGQEEDAADATAERYRRAAKAQVGEAQAALSASGVSSDEGSALRIQEQIIKDSESDALNTILSGERRGGTLSRQAEEVRRQGRSAKTAGYIGAAGTLLSTASSYGKASGWKGGSGSAVRVNG